MSEIGKNAEKIIRAGEREVQCSCKNEILQQRSRSKNDDILTTKLDESKYGIHSHMEKVRNITNQYWIFLWVFLFTHRISDQELPCLALLHADLIFILKILTDHKHVYHSCNYD